MMFRIINLLFIQKFLFSSCLLLLRSLCLCSCRCLYYISICRSLSAFYHRNHTHRRTAEKRTKTLQSKFSLFYRYKFSKITLCAASPNSCAARCKKRVPLPALPQNDADDPAIVILWLLFGCLSIHFVRQHNNDWQTNNSLMTMQLFVMRIHRWLGMEC